MIHNKVKQVAIVAGVLTLISIMPAMAQSTQVELTNYLGSTVWVNASNYNPKKELEVKVSNGAGALLFNETFKDQGQYKKALDFSKLQDGTYFIDVINDGGMVRKVVQVKSQDTKVEVSQSQTFTVSQLIRKIDHKRYAVNFSNDLDSEVDLQIIDRFGNVVYSETSAPGEEINKLFNLSKLDKGSYSLAFTSKDYRKFYNVEL